MKPSSLLTAPAAGPTVLPSSTLKLVGARVAVDAHSACYADIEIHDGRIFDWAAQNEPKAPDRSGRSNSHLTLDLSGHLILPGLINAHDHLEFNLFPRLGNGPYANFEAWAWDIYHPDRSPVREQLAVPKPVRLWWGALKNLLCGVTTVCQHNPYRENVFSDGFPINVVKRYGWAHSLAFGEDVAEAFRRTPPDAPFVIHLGEGTDDRSRKEIFKLERQKALDARTVIVHGVGLDEAGLSLLHRRGAGLVWCPTSNQFTLGTTLDAAMVRRAPRIALGTDSALTAQGNLLDEISAVRRQGLHADEIYPLVTRRAAEVLCLRDGEGSLKVGGRADLLAIKDTGCAPGESLLACGCGQIELVMVAGSPRMVSPEMAGCWPEEALSGFEPLCIEGSRRFVRAPVRSLWEQASEHLGAEVRLAGRKVEA